MVSEVRKRRIMIVDDDIFNVQAIQGLLEVLKVETNTGNVDFCYNGEEAVNLVEKAIE